MAPQSNDLTPKKRDAQRKKRVRALHEQAEAIRALADPLRRSPGSKVHSPSAGDSNRVVAFIKNLMRDHKLTIPQNLSEPKCTGNNFTQN